MPKIRVREVDNTGTPNSIGNPHVVYIPGPAASKVDAKLFTSAKAFKDAIYAEGSKYSQGSMSEKMAYHLLTLGMHVLYEGVEVAGGTADPAKFEGTADVDENGKFTIDGIEFTINAAGDEVSWEIEEVADEAAIAATDNVYQATITNGVIKNLENNILKFDFITNKVYYTKAYSVDGEPTEATWNTIWGNLTDKNMYNLRFLTTGQFFTDNSNAVKMIECAAKRCDAVALLDFKTVYDNVSEYRASADAVENASESLFLDTTKDPATFGAAFAPKWKGRINTASGLVEVDNLPPCFAYLCAFARSVKENPMWYAVAGSYRGTIPELIEVKKEYNNADVEMLQARSKTMEVALDETGDNVGVAINPIAYRRPFGHIIWGNRTLRDNKADENSGTGLLKATSFLNCRVLSTEVAKVAYNASNKYTFEQNNEVLWTNFTTYILPTLDRMSTGNGILDYKITRVATDKKARLCAKIALVPIEPAEDFDITIEMTDEISVTE